MEGIVICLGRARNAGFRKPARIATDPKLAKRYLIIINLDEGKRVSEIARVLAVAESTVRRVRRRFLEEGEAGLIDRREDNGEIKLSEEYLAKLDDAVAASPEEYGYRRPTWTRELLCASVTSTGSTLECWTDAHHNSD